ncbi:TonB-dependent receptor [soil metagenome]
MRATSLRLTLLTCAAIGALAVLPSYAAAQTPAGPSAEDEGSDVGELVVTGTRAAPRSRLDTVAPVDVVTGETLTKSGIGTELAAGLAQQVPSLDFPRPAISDGSDHVRPAILRGLAPDQTLVLLNGVRGHVSALVDVNGNLGRGSTSFDLNTIPTIALGQVEVLRDGASAQYGADAIAGVINLRLREASSGGAVTINGGLYDTEFKTSRGQHKKKTDGGQAAIAGWMGLPLGNDGFLTLSAELQNRNPTNRSDFANLTAVPNYPAGTILGRFGDPDLKSAAGYYNAGLPVGDNWKAYSFGGIQYRESESAATARAYNNAGNVVAVYPNGFLPKIGTKITDANLFGGLRGDAAGFAWDINAGYGSNKLDYRTFDSINASYGTASQTSFDSGNLAYDQLTLGVDGTRMVSIGLADPVNLAIGAEYRREGYEIGAGEPASYTKGPLAAAGLSQGFGGFRPSNVVDVNRSNVAVFIDVEGNLSKAFQFGAAARYEDYSDFGDQLTGKLSARYDFSPAFAIRGAVSNGFKAPALQQQFFSYTSTNAVTTIVAGVPTTTLIESGKFKVNDAAAIALGAKPLKPETSTNYSLGAVLRIGRFELTTDAYQIKLKDRITLSENLGVASPTQSAATVAIVQTLLAPYGVSAAQFFLNGVDTTTKGLDVVAHYRILSDRWGRYDLTAAANLNNTNVTRTPDLPTISATPSPAFLFDRGNVLSLEEGTPELKIVTSVDWQKDSWGAMIKATSYDSVLVPNNNVLLDYKTGPAILIDMEGRYEFKTGANIAIGLNNAFDKYPNFTPGGINSPTGSVGFPQYSPYGFNGRFVYARAGFKW